MKSIVIFLVLILVFFSTLYHSSQLKNNGSTLKHLKTPAHGDGEEEKDEPPDWPPPGAQYPQDTIIYSHVNVQN